MKNDKLALFGGRKTITKTFRRFNTIGLEEKNAVDEVIQSGVLSQFLGCWSEDFYGGPKVRQFEQDCAKYFQVKHAVTVNSWTSGLIAAVGAIGIEPGDEVIVSPWTMCASATAILHWNAIPVFADIEANTFNIDPDSIEKNISPQTKAIMAVDIFGHSADMNTIMHIAEKYDLKIISDTAQSPGALYNDKYAGTLAHVGGYSLNYHKHIHTGEGGILVTNDDEIADRLKLIRNHAEAVVGDKQTSNISNMLGYNFRMGEIEAAIGIEQLKKLSTIVSRRQHIARKLTDGIKSLDGIRPPIVEKDCTHSYYVYPLVLDDILCKHRDIIHQALVEEGLRISKSYQNLHLLPMYQNKIAFGSKGFPWNSDICKREVNYNKGICPTAESFNDHSYMGIGLCVHDLDDADVNLIIETFHKVWSNMDRLIS